MAFAPRQRLSGTLPPSDRVELEECMRLVRYSPFGIFAICHLRGLDAGHLRHMVPAQFESEFDVIASNQQSKSGRTVVSTRVEISDPRTGKVIRTATVAVKCFRVDFYGEAAKPRPGRALREHRKEVLNTWTTIHKELASLFNPRLNGCDYITQVASVNIPYVSRPQSQYFMVRMEQAEASLAHYQAYLKECGQPLTLHEKRDICCNLFKGLKALHCEGIAHGDIKSENVLIFRSNLPGRMYHAKLTDLDGSFCVVADAPLISPGGPGFLPVFTRPNEAPEIHRGLRYKSLKPLFRMDAYSLGILIWRVHLDGIHPFQRHIESTCTRFTTIYTTPSPKPIVVDFQGGSDDHQPAGSSRMLGVDEVKQDQKLCSDLIRSSMATHFSTVARIPAQLASVVDIEGNVVRHPLIKVVEDATTAILCLCRTRPDERELVAVGEAYMENDSKRLQHILAAVEGVRHFPPELTPLAREWALNQDPSPPASTQEIYSIYEGFSKILLGLGTYCRLDLMGMLSDVARILVQAKLPVTQIPDIELARGLLCVLFCLFNDGQEILCPSSLGAPAPELVSAEIAAGRAMTITTGGQAPMAPKCPSLPYGHVLLEKMAQIEVEHPRISTDSAFQNTFLWVRQVCHAAGRPVPDFVIAHGQRWYSNSLVSNSSVFNPLVATHQRDLDGLVSLGLFSSRTELWADVIRRRKSTPLLAAMLDNSVGPTQEVIPPFIKQGPNGQCAWQLAIKAFDDRAIAAYMQDPDFSATITDTWGNTPLHVACAAGNWKVAQHLLELGAAPEVPNTAGLIPLHFIGTSCWMEGDKAGLKTVATKLSLPATYGSSLINAQSAPSTIHSQQRLTPLWLAVMAGNTLAVKVLLELGATVELEDLKLASMRAMTEVLGDLIARRWSVEAMPDPLECDAVLRAQLLPRPIWLMRYGPQWLSRALTATEIVFKALQKHGVQSLNTFWVSGMIIGGKGVVLHHFFRGRLGNTPLSRWLANHAAELLGWTKIPPLQRAIIYNDRLSFEALLRAGADVSAGWSAGQIYHVPANTSLALACMCPGSSEQDVCWFVERILDAMPADRLMPEAAYSLARAFCAGSFQLAKFLHTAANTREDLKGKDAFSVASRCDGDFTLLGYMIRKPCQSADWLSVWLSPELGWPLDPLVSHPDSRLQVSVYDLAAKNLCFRPDIQDTPYEMAVTTQPAVIESLERLLSIPSLVDWELMRQQSVASRRQTLQLINDGHCHPLIIACGYLNLEFVQVLFSRRECRQLAELWLNDVCVIDGQIVGPLDVACDDRVVFTHRGSGPSTPFEREEFRKRRAQIVEILTRDGKAIFHRRPESQFEHPRPRPDARGYMLDPKLDSLLPTEVKDEILSTMAAPYCLNQQRALQLNNGLFTDIGILLPNGDSPPGQDEPKAFEFSDRSLNRYYNRHGMSLEELATFEESVQFPARIVAEFRERLDEVSLVGPRTYDRGTLSSISGHIVLANFVDDEVRDAMNSAMRIRETTECADDSAASGALSTDDARKLGDLIHRGIFNDLFTDPSTIQKLRDSTVRQSIILCVLVHSLINALRRTMAESIPDSAYKIGARFFSEIVFPAINGGIRGISRADCFPAAFRLSYGQYASLCQLACLEFQRHSLEDSLSLVNGAESRTGAKIRWNEVVPELSEDDVFALFRQFEQLAKTDKLHEHIPGDYTWDRPFRAMYACLELQIHAFLLRLLAVETMPRPGDQQHKSLDDLAFAVILVALHNDIASWPSRNDADRRSIRLQFCQRHYWTEQSLAEATRALEKILAAARRSAADDDKRGALVREAVVLTARVKSLKARVKVLDAIDELLVRVAEERPPVFLCALPDLPEPDWRPGQASAHHVGDAVFCQPALISQAEAEECVPEHEEADTMHVALSCLGLEDKPPAEAARIYDSTAPPRQGGPVHDAAYIFHCILQEFFCDLEELAPYLPARPKWSEEWIRDVVSCSWGFLQSDSFIL